MVPAYPDPRHQEEPVPYPLSLEEGSNIVPPADSICQVFKEIFTNNFLQYFISSQNKMQKIK